MTRNEMLIKLYDFCSQSDCSNCQLKFNSCNFEELEDRVLKNYLALANLTNDELVEHPNHYNRDGAMETIDEMLLLFGVEEVMSFCKLNAWKYRARAINKNGLEDMEKSDWYLKKYEELKGSVVHD